ncbi:hypothetical protein ACHAXR_002042 [Thalassiosira sp. AJA248-18]
MSNPPSVAEVCANCGKTSEDEGVNPKNCSSCFLVKYCGRECQKKHWTQHKLVCRRRAAELHDEALFGEGHTYYEEDCPICMLQLPLDPMDYTNKACCSKKICDGCILSAKKTGMGELCPFCKQTTAKTDAQIVASAHARVAAKDYVAMDVLGESYLHGRYGLPRDVPRAIEMLNESAKHGVAKSHNSLGVVYGQGVGGVARDLKKAIYHYELAARKGHPKARHNLGVLAERSRQYDRALRHYMIAANMGKDSSLKAIKNLFENGYAKKSDYGSALKGYQDAVEELSSPERKDAKLQWRDTSGDCVIQ